MAVIWWKKKKSRNVRKIDYCRAELLILFVGSRGLCDKVNLGAFKYTHDCGIKCIQYSAPCLDV